jgi:hypothetical protein
VKFTCFSCNLTNETNARIFAEICRHNTCLTVDDIHYQMNCYSLLQYSVAKGETTETNDRDVLFIAEILFIYMYTKGIWPLDQITVIWTVGWVLIICTIFCNMNVSLLASDCSIQGQVVKYSNWRETTVEQSSAVHKTNYSLSLCTRDLPYSANLCFQVTSLLTSIRRPLCQAELWAGSC